MNPLATTIRDALLNALSVDAVHGQSIRDRIERGDSGKPFEPQVLKYSRIESAAGQTHLWGEQEESKHPRAPDGEWTKKGGESRSGKQGKLFDKSGIEGQMNLFPDTAVPDSLVQQPAEKSEVKTEPAPAPIQEPAPTTTATTKPKPTRHEFEKSLLGSTALIYRLGKNLKIPHQELDDFVGDVQVKAIRGWDKFDPNKAQFNTWLGTIATRLAIGKKITAHALKRGGGNKTLSLSTPAGQSEDSGKTLTDFVADYRGHEDSQSAANEKLADVKKIKSAVDGIAPLQKLAIKGVLIEGKSQEEVADEHGVSRQAINHAIKIGIQRIKEKLGLKDGEPNRYQKNILARVIYQRLSGRVLKYKRFEESKHPRGQPENAGEFAENPGAKKTKRPSGKEFVDQDPATKPIMEERSSEWISKLSQSDIHSIQQYSHGRDAYINEALRDCGDSVRCFDDEQDFSDYRNCLKAVIAANGLSQPVTTYRGITGAFAQEIFDQIKNGAEGFVEKGFVSTSISSAVAREFALNSKTAVVLRIKAKSGAYIDPISHHEGEMELLQKPGTAYKFIEVHENVEFKIPSGKRLLHVIDLEEI